MPDALTNAVVLDFDQIFAAYMAKNQKVWGHNRKLTLGASEVWQCIRKGFFEKRGEELGYVPDEGEQSWGALERGNLIENHFVVPAVAGSMPPGLDVLYTGDNQVTLVAGRNSATPDGLITGLPKGCALHVKGGTSDFFIPDIKSDCVVFEVKSIDPRANLVHEKAVHHGQTQMQIGLYHEKTEWRPYYSIILYVDASFLDKLTPFVVEFEPQKFAIGQSRAEALWQHDDPTTFLPEGKLDGSCDYCRWRAACGEAILSAMPAAETASADPTIVADISADVEDYLKLRDDVEDATRRFKLAGERLKEGLLQHKIRKVPAANWSVVWSQRKGNTSLDKDAMERAGIDLSRFEKQGAGYDVLTVTRTADKEARKANRKPKTKQENPT